MDLESFINLHKSKHSELTSKLEKYTTTFSEDNFFEFVSLVRQIYLSSTNLNDCNFIKIPTHFNISRDKWTSFGFEFTEFNNEKSIRPSRWKPKFLKNLQIDDITEQWNKLELHRKNLEIKTDTFVKNVTGFDTYTSPVQREALARILFMPEGDTMVVNLPTGSGKSLLFQLSPLMDGLRSGLTLVVVPTISLAIDQARRMSELLKERNISFDHDLAWYGGLDDNKRNQIKENIRNGTQGILFASPEAVVGALLPSLFKAVSRGLLNFLCVDEAHLLVDWGDTFRPDYHLLSAIRNGLLHSCKDKQFKTLLFSATFTPSALSLIDVLFAPKNKVHLISGIFLRPEPKYYIGKMTSKEEQRKTILDLIPYVPKPMIIYTTEPRDAKTIYSQILDQKFNNVELFHGSTSGEKKKQIISEWANNEIDIVVGTSAFGVGVDKANVRTIIHASIPETLDRFYQEVGRSGRDGQSSISIILDTKEDRITAENIANDESSNISGHEKAYQRWKKLISQAEAVLFEGEEFYAFNINAPRPGLKGESNFNKMHNLLTLNILSRAGLISLYKDPPKQENEENAEAYDFNSEAFWEKYYGSMLIKINKDIRNEEHFKNVYESSKNIIKKSRLSSLKTLYKVLDGDLSVERAVSSIFTSDEPGRELSVTEVCRGCPNNCSCNLYYTSPQITGDVKTINFSDSWEDKWLDNHRRIILFPSTINNINDKNIRKTIEIIINHYGVKQVILDEKFIQDFDKNISTKIKNSVLFVNTIQDLMKIDYNTNNIFFNIPTLTILCPWEKNLSVPENFVEKIKPFNIILAPEYLKSFGSYKPLKIKDPNLTDIETFIDKETI